MNMTIAEKIERLEHELFLLDMKDRWTRADFEKDRELWRKIKYLKEKQAKELAE